MPTTAQRTLKVALVSQVFPEPDDLPRLKEVLVTARAHLAVLPELPFNVWAPATDVPESADAEGSAGWRACMLSSAAAGCGCAILGGVIRRSIPEGLRYNTALLVNRHGAIVAVYEKLHLPHEPGFWEASHYKPGRTPPQVIRESGARLGIQICSDGNRPVGAQLLAAQGVEVILCPRATSSATYHRWRLAYRAMALTASAFVVSVNRPGPEAGVPIGGPSLVVDPEGIVLLETEEPISTVTLDLDRARHAKLGYPGYLAFPAHSYAEAWAEVAKKH